MPARARRAYQEEEPGVVRLHAYEDDAPPEDAPLGAAPYGVDAGVWATVAGAASWLKASDALVVRCLVDALVEYGQARAAVAEQGTMVLTSTGAMVPNPWHRVMSERRIEVTKLARDLALTPSARKTLLGRA